VVSNVKIDMDGQKRTNQKGIGADEISAEKIINHPLKSTEVGPKWMMAQKTNSKIQL
jgi:hypothetical protein